MAAPILICILRIFFTIFNIIILALALWIIVVSGILMYILHQVHDHKSIVDFSTFNAIGVFVIVIGVILILLVLSSFFGICFGSSCVFITFLVLMGLLMIAQGGAIGYIESRNKDQIMYRFINDTLEGLLQTAANNYGRYIGSTVISVMQSLQSKFECCGNNNYKDYERLGMDYRAYCQKPDKKTYYQKGCRDILLASYKKHKSVVGFVIYGLFGFEAVSAILAFLLLILQDK